MPIRRRPTTDQLYWRFQHRGRTYERSMETSNVREATQRGMAWEVEVKSAEAEPALAPTLAVLRDKDIARLRALGRNEDYIRSGIKAKYANLIRFFPDVRAINPDSLEDYVKFRRKEGVRAQTITKELTCLKRGMLQMRLRIPEHWPKEPKDRKDKRLASKGHDLKAWRAWLAALAKQRDPEAHSLALFALVTGLRHGELYRVQRDDLQVIDDFWVLQVHEKIRRENPRKIVLGPIGQALWPALPFQREHRTGFLRASQVAEGSITLRDCRAAFRSAAGIARDRDASDMAMGHSGIPSLYIKEHFDRLYGVACAVENWLYPAPHTGDS